MFYIPLSSRHLAQSMSSGSSSNTGEVSEGSSASGGYQLVKVKLAPYSHICDQHARSQVQVEDDVSTYNKRFVIKYPLLPKLARFSSLLGIQTHPNKESIIAFLRKSYEKEAAANDTTYLKNDYDKIKLFLESLAKLQDIEQIYDQSSPELNLFLYHQKAKLNYEIGVICLRSNESFDDLLTSDKIEELKSIDPQHFFSLDVEEGEKNIHIASNYFKRALECYPNDDCDAVYTRSLVTLDSYYPLLRKAAILTNLKVCEDEGFPIIDDIDRALSAVKVNINCSKYSKNSETKRILSQIEKVLAIRDIDDDQPSSDDASLPSGSTDLQAIPSKRKRSEEKGVTSRKARKTEKKQIDFYHHHCNLVADAKYTSDSSHWLRGDPTESSLFLRERQRDNMSAIYQSFKRHYSSFLDAEKVPRVMVTKPTGSGKSILMLELSKKCIENNQPVIIVVPRNALVDQFKSNFDDFLAKHPEDLHVLKDKYTIYSALRNQRKIGPVTIITQDSFIQQIKKLNEGNPSLFTLDALKKSMVLLDEAHHAAGKKFREHFLANDTFKSTPVVGFSASTAEMEIDYREISSHFLHQPVKEDLRELIENNELSSIQFAEIDFSFYKEAKDLLKRIKHKTSDKDAEEEVNKTLTNQLSFSLTACDQFIKQMKLDGARKGLVFASGISHAEQLTKMLTKLSGSQVYAYHSGLPDREREEILANFKDPSNKNAILVSVDALDEGFDCPDVNRVLDFGYYKHKVRRLYQRLGRALRLRDDGSDTSYISVKLFKYKNFSGDDGQILPRKFLFDNQGQVGSCKNNFSIQPTLPNDLAGDDFGFPGTTIKASPAKLKQSHETKALPLGVLPPEFSNEEEDNESGGDPSVPVLGTPGAGSLDQSTTGFGGASYSGTTLPLTSTGQSSVDLIGSSIGASSSDPFGHLAADGADVSSEEVIGLLKESLAGAQGDDAVDDSSEDAIQVDQVELEAMLKSWIG